MTKLKITKSMLENLEYDLHKNELTTKMETVSAGQHIGACSAMFVFANGDLNAAAYHLIESMKSPFSSGAISSVYVEEAVLERFITMVRPQLPNYDTKVTQHPGYKVAKESASRLNAKIVGEISNSSSGAIIVCDFTHEHLGSDASAIVTLNTFRTAKESIALFGKETLKCENVTIWNENHSCAYELVAALHSTNFFINCHKVSMEPLNNTNASRNYVTMDKAYHYELLSVNGIQKRIVFPIGTIFAN